MGVCERDRCAPPLPALPLPGDPPIQAATCETCCSSRIAMVELEGDDGVSLVSGLMM